MRVRLGLVGIVASAAVVFAMAAGAQECDDFSECTANDMCSIAGGCVGTPVSGVCDDFSECTTNDHCLGGECTGAPVADGTLCGTDDPCSRGTCQGGECTPSDHEDEPCEDALGACTTNDRCQDGLCIGDLVECPDVDGNPCTFEFCDVLSGRCEGESFSFCDECEACDPDTQECLPANEGAACDDLDACTENDRCQEGLCQGDLPPSPCDGDCNMNGIVSIDELVRGVNIALENDPIDLCPAFDQDGSEAVEINELIAAVGAALNGCPGGA